MKRDMASRLWLVAFLTAWLLAPDEYKQSVAATMVIFFGLRLATLPKDHR
jgi:hypothetical protein